MLKSTLSKSFHKKKNQCFFITMQMYAAQESNKIFVFIERLFKFQLCIDFVTLINTALKQSRVKCILFFISLETFSQLDVSVHTM